MPTDRKMPSLEEWQRHFLPTGFFGSRRNRSLTRAEAALRMWYTSSTPEARAASLDELFLKANDVMFGLLPAREGRGIFERVVLIIPVSSNNTLTQFIKNVTDYIFEIMKAEVGGLNDKTLTYTRVEAMKRVRRVAYLSSVIRDLTQDDDSWPPSSSSRRSSSSEDSSCRTTIKRSTVFTFSKAHQDASRAGRLARP
jgi:hypothetical protein